MGMPRGAENVTAQPAVNGPETPARSKTAAPTENVTSDGSAGGPSSRPTNRANKEIRRELSELIKLRYLTQGAPQITDMESK